MHLKEARETLNLTQEQLAEKIGSCRESVSHWENGEIPQQYWRDQLDKLFGLGVVTFREAEQKQEKTMQEPLEPKREQPSTYFVEDRSNQEELTRLSIQDQFVTNNMGGVLKEQSDPSRFHRVLDAGCGTGSWLINVAQALPTSTLLVGIDISQKFINYAREQARAAGVSNRVEFHVADALLSLEFPDKFFDLVNHRFGLSWLRIWDWPKLLKEYQRVARPGGIVRVNEYVAMATKTISSPALEQLNALASAASFQSGHFFTPTNEDITNSLVRLFEQHGLQAVNSHRWNTEIRANTPQGQSNFENAKIAYRVIIPFLRKWTHFPDDYEEIYQQMLNEMQQPNFVATWHMATVWATKN